LVSPSHRNLLLERLDREKLTNQLDVVRSDIHPNHTLIVAVGDRTKIETPLKDLNLAPIELVYPHRQPHQMMTEKQNGRRASTLRPFVLFCA
jgi:hypothetical protein